MPAFLVFAFSDKLVLEETKHHNSQVMQQARTGPKLLLISHQLGQTQTLSEIENPDEADRLASLCKETSQVGLSKTFRQVFQDFATKPTRIERDSDLRVSKSGGSKGLASKG